MILKIKIKYNDSNNFSKYSSKYISEYVSIYDRIVTGILVCYRFPRSYRMGLDGRVVSWRLGGFVGEV